MQAHLGSKLGSNSKSWIQDPRDNRILIVRKVRGQSPHQIFYKVLGQIRGQSPRQICPKQHGHTRRNSSLAAPRRSPPQATPPT